MMFIGTRLRVIWVVTWVVSALSLIYGLFFIRDPNISRSSEIVANLMVQAGGAFFFALTVGWVIDRMRDSEGYSVLWLFSQEFRKAGVMSFFSDRLGEAEKALELAFEKYDGGEVLLAGASLRLFLAPGLHFSSSLERVLRRKGSSPIHVKALSCSPECNFELPVRSFVEEFNQDKTHPKKDIPFDWNERIDFSFKEYVQTFFEKYGINTKEECRVINDLKSTRQGVAELGAKANSNNSISHREFNFSPYCTVIIFPDRAFYTPNLLSTEVPINLPMIVFHKSSTVYDKLLSYFKFLWWVSDPDFKE